jgi:hemin uptake protein HemP
VPLSKGMEGEALMHPQSPCAPDNPGYFPPRPPRQKVSTADLMRGGRELVLLHDGQEYILRITKAGKLILTK